MKRAKKRQIKFLGQRYNAFVEALLSMPNVGTDADFARDEAGNPLVQFIRDARPTTTSLDFRLVKDQSSA